MSATTGVLTAGRQKSKRLGWSLVIAIALLVVIAVAGLALGRTSKPVVKNPVAPALSVGGFPFNPHAYRESLANEKIAREIIARVHGVRK